MPSGVAIKEFFRTLAVSLGFPSVGFASCGPFSEDKERINKWFSDGYAGPLDYLSPDRISGINKVFPGAKTAIVVFFPYARPSAIPGNAPESLKLSRFLWGPDYHWILKTKLNGLLEYIQSMYPDISGKTCVDTAPIMERSLAVRAGLGWQGKNTLLVAGKSGSWGFLGSLLIDLELEPDHPFEGNRCGSCRRCIDSCPTGALESFRLDCRRCLSTWNIERHGNPPPEVSQTISNTGWVAGCDICQEVCPWNNEPVWGDAELWGSPHALHAKPASELRFTSNQWKKITAGTALRRVSFRHWMSNLESAEGKNISG